MCVCVCVCVCVREREREWWWCVYVYWLLFLIPPRQDSIEDSTIPPLKIFPYLFVSYFIYIFPTLRSILLTSLSPTHTHSHSHTLSLSHSRRRESCCIIYKCRIFLEKAFNSWKLFNCSILKIESFLFDIGVIV